MFSTDQMNRQVMLPDAPQRIVSLVPSQTELLFQLGLGDRVVGVTKFCVHPAEQVKNVQKIGGTKNFRFDLIDHLQPDLIIGNKEENYQVGIERLQQKYPVWMSDIYNLPDALEMISGIGTITQTVEAATSLRKEIERQFNTLPALSPTLRTAYLIWRGPYMAAGKNTFIDHVMTLCGLANVFPQSAGRYPEVTTEALQALDPKVILLSSEPYPFQEKHLQELQDICPKARILLVDGELFSWYGSRLLYTVPYLEKLLPTLKTG